jgi:hypothetical protein
MARWEVVVLIAAAGLMIAWRAAKLAFDTGVGAVVVKTEPWDAKVRVDDIEVATSWPEPIAITEGSHTLSVTRDGYTGRHEIVEVRSDHTMRLSVKLEPSPENGFELTSEPPGQPVWFDGEPVRLASGAQARTDFRDIRVAPGRHTIEIRGERVLPWRQDIEVTPGMIRKVHAILVEPRQTTADEPPAVTFEESHRQVR